ncbi:unnamed protein product [Paramecium primaurelia]|uniref:Uncharacterized protein n=1 Tax=Paramecium primaurelia TaxID=5886 RepID=A0A8S1NE46_PARPR|nr:unnamed protein product [Paramecium primaurelia]
MYNLPDSLSKRMAGIGYGQKHDFTKYVKQVPTSKKYDIKNFAELNIEEKKGIQSALGREDIWLQGIWTTLTKFTPSLNRYQIPSKDLAIMNMNKLLYQKEFIHSLNFRIQKHLSLEKIKNDIRHQENGMRSAVQQTFIKSIRKGPFEINKVTPVPGRYKMFSEFDQ